MISGHEIVMMHPEEYGLLESVVQAARKVTLALSHGRSPSHINLRELQRAMQDLNNVDTEQQDTWDEIVRNA